MPDRVGDLAVVLHSHMPYVEGFGTWPFGEEWLFDAFARSHLPVLEAARDMTLTVTPVLADQLEDGAVAERMREFVREHRLGAAERDASGAGSELRAAAEAEAGLYRRALERLEDLGDRPLAAFAEASEAGRVELMASAATHAVLPLVATAAGLCCTFICAASAIIGEGRLLARVRHPNVVTIYGADQISDQIGLWMEFVRGHTLEQILDQRWSSAPPKLWASVSSSVARCRRCTPPACCIGTSRRTT